MKILATYGNVNMSLAHKGLAVLLQKKFKIDVTQLEGDNVIMLLNSANTKLKAIGGKGQVIGYVALEKGRRIMLEAIQYLPQTFGGQGFNYDEALKLALISRLAKGPQRYASPLQVFRAMKGAGLTNSRKTNTKTIGVN